MAFDWTKLPLSGWIWTGEDNAALNPEPQIVFFRKTMVLEELPEAFTAKVSADSRYKLYVNGKLAEVGPEKGDAKVWFYETVDLLPYLVLGENVITAIVLRYPLTDRKGNHSIWRTERPGFYFYASPELLADSTWKFKHAGHVQILSENPYFAPLQIFENAAGAPWTAGWTTAGYDDSDWAAAVPYLDMQMPKAVSPGNLLPRPIPSLFRKEQRFTGVVTVREGAAAGWDELLRADKAVTVPAHSREIVEITAGELTTGYFSLGIAGGTGAKVHILYSEAYALPPKTPGAWGPEGQSVKKDREDHVNGQLYGYADDYTVSGHGTEAAPEIYEPFWFRTFRFVRLEVETAGEPLTLSHLKYTETGYPLEVKTWGETSDESLKAVWDISLRTLRRCMHESYEDCPFYEQLQYIMDSRSQMLFTYQVAADDRLARKCLDDFKRSARYDGLLNCSYPSYGPNVIPGFSIYYILMLYDHMMYFGDKELLRYHMPTVDGILEYFRRTLDDRGLVAKNGGHNGRARYWSFIDWVNEWDTGVPNATNQGPITMESLLYVYGLQTAAKLTKYLGREDTAEEYLARAAAVQAAVNTHCIGKNGLYQDGPGFEEYSQHCQVFAVLTDTCSPEEGRRLMEEILEHEYPKCSVAMAYYMFRALEKTGLYERTEKLWDIWREMVENNLTTCVESKEAAGDGRSDCHAWGSLILYELPAVVLGVQPAAPGYAEIRVSPRAGYFSHAEGEVITPRGLVKVHWKKKADGELDLNWSL